MSRQILILEQAHDALRTAVQGVTDWTAPTPCSDWNATQVLQHAAGDQIAFAAFLTGGPGPSENPFAPSGRLDTSPQSVLEQALKLSADAWAEISPDAEEVPVPVPPNKMTARLGVGACALDAAVHAWDIAMSSGAPSPLTGELARELLPVARQIVEPLRAYGAYAAALPPRPGDDDVAALLRYLGRHPEAKDGEHE
ncbi:MULTISPECIES: TIGR03086 family metal-binding protein [Nonomuraea]|uniref:TIGR03086 family metal-binding protein n=1 Tax=Nonomuraea mangrovi TaxID=2316207 RepID=A0ABW4TD06_9ACTN